MPTILQIDASVRAFSTTKPSRNSLSKSLSNGFKEQWLAKLPNTKFIYRDLSKTPPDFISEDWVSAAFTPESQRTEDQKAQLLQSDTLIDEVIEADIILLSTPMYNYGMPAVLKAWFDQVIRINKTFSFDLNRGDFPLKPSLSGKTMVLLTSCGEFGFEIGGMRENMNHLGPHIKVTSHYLGVETFFEIGSEYQEFGDERHAKSIQKAESDIAKLVEQLTSRL